MWTIHLLGGLRAYNSQRLVTRFRTQKAASLLAYLAFHATPQPREILSALLWPDAEPEVSRHNLSNALTFLRHILEPPGIPPGTVILADRFMVRLNPDAVTTDIAAFETAVGQARQQRRTHRERLPLLEQAAQLYQGPLLPGFYDEWIPAQTQRLESLFVQTVGQLIPELLAGGQSEKALSYAQRAITVDPLSEEITIGLMQALSASGQSAQALRAYQAFAQRLQEELDAQPSPVIQSLARRLESSSSPLPVLAQPDDAPPSEEPFTFLPARPGLPASQEPSPDTHLVRSAPSNRLLGGEFLLRTTTRFFGREKEIARLGRMLLTPRTRLVTLMGAGGMGKSRLALEAAAHLIESAPGGAPTQAVFVALADVVEAGRLPEIILRSFGILPDAKFEPMDQLVQALASQPNTLLVLDNFEQLAEEGALRVHDLLAKAATVKLLITSRQKLRIEGEREFHLAPLSLSGGAHSLEALLRVPSIALFVDRAQTAVPDFQLTVRNAAVVAQLCDHLEGLPLAIELAAARVALLSPKRILEHVQANRLDFLATQRRTAASRQRTLRVTLDWSYQLLPEAGQQFLAALSRFRGGWTLEAAQAVCALNEAETLELLTLLRDSSLIGVKDTEEGLRFTLLETIWEYAAEQLEQSGEKEIACRRHHDFFLALAEAAEPHLTGAEQVVWLDRLEREHDNLRTALGWSRGIKGAYKETKGKPQPLVPTILRFCGALYHFWSTRGHLTEGRMWCQIALDAEGSQERTAVRAKVLNGMGALALSQGDFACSRGCHEESLAIRREIGDPRDIATSLNDLGIVVRFQGDLVLARGYHEESLPIRREIGDRRGIGGSLSDLGVVAYLLGDYACARALHEESLAIRKEIDNRRGVAHSLNNLGMVARRQGELAYARTNYEESLAIRREFGDRQGLAGSLSNLGSVACEQGDYIAAQAYLEESLAIRREIGDRRGIANSLNNLGIVACEQGDYACGRKNYEESLAIQRKIGDRRGLAGSLGNLGSVACEQGDYIAAQAYLEESLKIQWEMRDLHGVALSLEAFVMRIAAEYANKILFAAGVRKVSEQTGEALRRAARLGATAQALRLRIGAPCAPKDQQQWDQQIAKMQKWLGETEWTRVWEEGHMMSLEAAIAYALEEVSTKTGDQGRLFGQTAGRN